MAITSSSLISSSPSPPSSTALMIASSCSFVIMVFFLLGLDGVTAIRAKTSKVSEQKSKQDVQSKAPRIISRSVQTNTSGARLARILPIVLLGFMAVRWTREQREARHEEAPNNRRSDG